MQAFRVRLMREMAESLKATEPVGCTMRYWLADAASEALQKSGARVETVAHMSGVSYTGIYRFLENKAQPREVEKILAAIAEVAGLEDNRALWARALELWYEHGYPARLRDADELPIDQAIEMELQAEAQRDRRADRSASRTGGAPSSPKKRRATG